MQDERVAFSGSRVGGIQQHEQGVSTEISPNGGLRAALRVLRPLVGPQSLAPTGQSETLEFQSRAGDPPTVAGCVVLELPGARAIAPTVSFGPEDDARVGIHAFLDGIQRSRIVAHVHGSPIIFASVGAAVRQRVSRRLETWGAPRIRHLLLASRVQVGEDVWSGLERADVAPVDLTEELTDGPAGSAAALAPADVAHAARGALEASTAPLLHPLALRGRSLERVGQERETLERRLAAEWCESETRWLWVDGGISGNLAINESATAFGVVKSHSTLYGDADMVRSTLALNAGERSALFVVQHRARRAVASWYLRLHKSAHGDPLHGLVRVEVAPPAALFAAAPVTATAADATSLHWLSTRADEISGWILAERAPVALPDPRWDTLTYGVYACEQFLKSLLGP